MARHALRRLGPRLAAEFAVIVVGVLVALWLEGWASDRQDRALEGQYVRALITDIKADSLAVAEIHLPTAERARSFLETALPMSQGLVPFSGDTLNFLRQMSASHLFPIVEESGPAYQELTATGTLRLLESAEVRAAVVEYYRFKLLVRNRIAIWESGYPQLVRSYLPQGMGLEGDMWLGASRDASVMSRAEIERVFSVVRTDAFTSAAYRHLNYLAGAEPTLRQWLSRARTTLETLSAELD